MLLPDATLAETCRDYKSLTAKVASAGGRDESTTPTRRLGRHTRLVAACRSAQSFADGTMKVSLTNGAAGVLMGVCHELTAVSGTTS